MVLSRCLNAQWLCWRASYAITFITWRVIWLQGKWRLLVIQMMITRLWHKRLEHTGEKYSQALAKKYLLQSAKSCKLKFCKHYVIGKKTKVKFGNTNHYTKGILNYVHIDVWDLPRQHLLEVTTTLSPLLMITLGDIGYILWNTKKKS